MNLNVDSWKEFRLGDLFSEMYKAEAHVKGELECYDVPLDNTIRFMVVLIGLICIQHCLSFQYLSRKNINTAMAELSKWN